MPEDIKHSIQVFNENTIDCLLLCAQPVNSIDFLTRILFRLPHVVTGNRILKTEVLKDFFGKTSIHRYQFEFLLNSYLIHHRMRTAYIDITAKNVWKTQKNGVFRGIGDDARMWCQILSGVSPVEMFRQIFFFARRKM